MKFLIILFVFVFPVFVFGQHGEHDQQQTEIKPAMLDGGVGNVDHPVSTDNAEAQKFFNQGLAYLYGFNHAEAIKSFKRAAELDPNLAMAYWGASLALGSNYNLTADAAQLNEAYANLQKAIALAPKASEIDRAYIAALTKRYSDDPQADRQKLALDYKTAMGELVKKYPDDLDAATLYAESMMNLRPWQLWSSGRQAGRRNSGNRRRAGRRFEAQPESYRRESLLHSRGRSLAQSRTRAGERDATRLLAPDAGHLVHMPSHIYIRTGDYVEAAKSNADAIVADRNYIAENRLARRLHDDVLQPQHPFSGRRQRDERSIRRSGQTGARPRN